MPEEVGEPGGSVCPSASLYSPIEAASDDFALHRRLVILSAIKVLLDVGDVDGAVGKEGVGEDAEGFASEFAEEALDACPARAPPAGCCACSDRAAENTGCPRARMGTEDEGRLLGRKRDEFASAYEKIFAAHRHSRSHGREYYCTAFISLA